MVHLTVDNFSNPLSLHISNNKINMNINDQIVQQELSLFEHILFVDIELYDLKGKPIAFNYNNYGSENIMVIDYHILPFIGLYSPNINQDAVFINDLNITWDLQKYDIVELRLYIHIKNMDYFDLIIL